MHILEQPQNNSVVTFRGLITLAIVFVLALLQSLWTFLLSFDNNLMIKKRSPYAVENSPK